MARTPGNTCSPVYRRGLSNAWPKCTGNKWVGHGRFRERRADSQGMRAGWYRTTPITHQRSPVGPALRLARARALAWKRGPQGRCRTTFGRNRHRGRGALRRRKANHPPVNRRAGAATT